MISLNWKKKKKRETASLENKGVYKPEMREFLSHAFCFSTEKQY
jgi:hypothetical protein